MGVNLFFDFDMTLGYRILMWKDTVRELLLEEGEVVSVDNIRKFSELRWYPWSMPELTHSEFFQGEKWWDYLEKYLYQSLLTLTSEDRAYNVSKRFGERYIDLKYWNVFPDTLPTLFKLKEQGYPMYILSNHVPEAKSIIASLGISKFIDKIFISADMGVEKPNPLIYRKALEVASPNDINIMIGDNDEADVEGAVNGGFDYAILVRKPNEIGHKYYARYLKDILPIVEEIRNENR